MSNKMIKQAEIKLSDLERSFLTYWRMLAPDSFPVPVPQYQFYNYRLDFAFPELKISVELDGGRGGGYGRSVRCHACGAVVRARTKDGRIGKPLRIGYPSHTGQGAERDLLKNNLLIAAGWYPLRYSSAMLDDNPKEVIDEVMRLIRRVVG